MNNFQATYGFIVLVTAILDVRIMQSQYSPSLIHFYCTGLFVQVVAVLLWSVDNLACDKLETLRRAGGHLVFLAPFTQLHGWWHVLAGYATYMHIVFCICQRQFYLDKGCSRGCSLQPHFLFGYTLKKLEQ